MAVCGVDDAAAVMHNIAHKSERTRVHSVLFKEAKGKIWKKRRGFFL